MDDMPKPLTVPQPDQLIRLDTGAFRAARAARATRTLAYWVVLCVLAAGICVSIVVVSTALGGDRTALVPTQRTLPAVAGPPPAETPVMVWNATRVAGAANRIKIRLANLGYPADAARAHGLPKKVAFKGTWVLATPGNAAAAATVAASLGLDPAERVRPLDGLRPEEIAPAVVLVLVGT
jgi:LytR cell envelope-related transcriptional attenuator